MLNLPNRYVLYINLWTHFLLFVMMFCLVGCGASYVTPGGPAPISSLTEPDIQKALDRKPASPFPARLAVVRVQAPDYRSYRCESYGHGRYSVVTTRDIETNEYFDRLAQLPMISAVGRINRILIPSKLNSGKELRIAAANLHADLLFAYTFDTVFRVKDHDIGPMGVITLGFLPNHEAQVTSTASAAVLDVRTGFVYGLAEATVRAKEWTTVWTSTDTVDDLRRRAETKAFEELLDELAITWKGIVQEHAAKLIKASVK